MTYADVSPEASASDATMLSCVTLDHRPVIGGAG